MKVASRRLKNVPSTSSMDCVRKFPVTVPPPSNSSPDKVVGSKVDAKTEKGIVTVQVTPAAT
jgi:hypothetical protein